MLIDDGTDAAPEDNTATTLPADQAVNSRRGETNSSSGSSKADKNSADSSEHSKDTSNNRDLLHKHSSTDFFEDEDNVGDDDNMSGDSSIINDNISQFDISYSLPY